MQDDTDRKGQDDLLERNRPVLEQISVLRHDFRGSQQAIVLVNTLIDRCVGRVEALEKREAIAMEAIYKIQGKINEIPPAIDMGAVEKMVTDALHKSNEDKAKKDLMVATALADELRLREERQWKRIKQVATGLGILLALVPNISKIVEWVAA